MGAGHTRRGRASGGNSRRLGESEDYARLYRGGDGCAAQRARLQRSPTSRSRFGESERRRGRRRRRGRGSHTSTRKSCGRHCSELAGEWRLTRAPRLARRAPSGRGPRRSPAAPPPPRTRRPSDRRHPIEIDGGGSGVQATSSLLRRYDHRLLLLLRTSGRAPRKASNWQERPSNHPGLGLCTPGKQSSGFPAIITQSRPSSHAFVCTSQLCGILHKLLLSFIRRNGQEARKSRKTSAGRNAAAVLPRAYTERVPLRGELMAVRDRTHAVLVSWPAIRR